MHWLAVAGSLAFAGPQPPLVFSASTELVHVVVSVTNENGEPIRGLQAKDFAVSEDGKPRSVATFAACGDISTVAETECPVDLVLLWDTSTSMLDNLRRARDAAVKFVEAVPAANGRTVIAFDSKVQVATYDPGNPAVAFDEILSGEVGGATRFFDAVREGIARASLDPTRRVIMVALSDGEDSGAWRRPDFGLRLLSRPRGNHETVESEPVSDIAKALQNESVTFYAISFSKHLLREEREKRARENLQTLTKATGGLVIDGEAPDMNSQFDAIRRDISTQYVLGFVPGTSAPGRTHGIKVKVAAKDAKVRHRPAYQTKPPR